MDGPFLSEIAVHHFDSFRYLFDRQPASIFAASSAGEQLRQGGGRHGSPIELDGGLPIRVQQQHARLPAMSSSSGIEGERGDPWTDRKRVWWRARGGRFFLPANPCPSTKGDELPVPESSAPCRCSISFRKCVMHGRVPETSAGENLWTLAMVEASVRCSTAGPRKVAIGEVFSPALRREAGLAIA